MYNIGIDLGGTNIKVGVVNDDFKIVGKSNIKNRPAPSCRRNRRQHSKGC